MYPSCSRQIYTHKHINNKQTYRICFELLIRKQVDIKLLFSGLLVVHLHIISICYGHNIIYSTIYISPSIQALGVKISGLLASQEHIGHCAIIWWDTQTVPTKHLHHCLCLLYNPTSQKHLVVNYYTNGTVYIGYDFIL